MPDHVPALADNVCPSAVEPETIGSAVFAGASAATTPVTADVAEDDPVELLAVTTTRSVVPTSPWPSAYVAPVAPATFAHAPPDALQLCHWYA